MAYAIAKRMGVSFFIEMAATTFLRKYIGEGEQKLREMFALANKNAPAVIFMDEIDGFGTQRQEKYNLRGMKLALLTSMNAMHSGVVLIAATNCPHHLDDALIRRFNMVLYVGLPEFQERYDLLKKYLKPALNLTVENFIAFGNRTDG